MANYLNAGFGFTEYEWSPLGAASALMVLGALVTLVLGVSETRGQYKAGLGFHLKAKTQQLGSLQRPSHVTRGGRG